MHIKIAFEQKCITLVTSRHVQACEVSVNVRQTDITLDVTRLLYMILRDRQTDRQDKHVLL